MNEEFGRGVVSFTINEGGKAFVEEVDFQGNKAFADKDLRKTFKKIRKKNFFSFINKSGLYNDDDFQDDIQHLKDFYQAHGYMDMEVKDTDISYPEAGKIKVTIKLFEGIQYKVGAIKVDGNQLFDEAAIRKELKMPEGSVFVPKGLKDADPSLENDIKAIKDLYGKKGYIDAEVKPERLPNVENARIDLDYHITEGAQSFVDRIVIEGNNRTKDKVIRRELPLAPGDVYDSVRADAAKKRLENLGYFEKVDVSPQDTSVPNRRNMVVNVEEKRTGSITFGAGFSSVDSLLGFVELSQGNFDIQNFPYFTGGGQKFRTRVQYGLERKDFTLNFTEPWFLDRRWPSASTSSRGSPTTRAPSTPRSTSAPTSGWPSSSIRSGRPRSNTASRSRASTPSTPPSRSTSPACTPRAAPAPRAPSPAPSPTTPATASSWPRHGEKLAFTLKGAGGPLWGQTNIYQAQIDAQKVFLLPADLIFSINASTGIVNNYGSSPNVPLFERYFLGGSRSVRGFDNQGVGPVFPGTTEPEGGRTDGYAQFELSAPVVDRVRVALFYDAGFVESKFADYSHAVDDYNAAVGVGLRLNLPIGPLRFDYGIPVKSTDVNKSTGRFDFDVGYQF